MDGKPRGQSNCLSTSVHQPAKAICRSIRPCRLSSCFVYVVLCLLSLRLRYVWSYSTSSNSSNLGGFPSYSIYLLAPHAVCDFVCRCGRVPSTQ